ncbi:histidine ammonia-lyase (plasmid) [Paraburkholderia graminis]|uniref:histidine ammonia-lyase n=1 Tax=Paraburkholderia graminis TaxID=60548 RepID=UPI000DEFD984|nr:histidine ammonia-lyase [Paraburkholderia graminis]AXF12612.1 histidine ammonia-lyase [Paraburkholderia graminis]
MNSIVEISPGHTQLGIWRAVLSGDAARLHQSAQGSVESAAEMVEQLVRAGKPVYGLNTGFGKLAHVRISDADLSKLQQNLVMSHMTGYGPPLDANVVRLAMALKIASLGRGASGAKLRTVHLLEQMLERGVVPVIPAQGSVGASGDLAPLAHMSAVLTGGGEAVYQGEVLSGAQALARAGLAPISLAPKEGLALMNGTQVSTALALCGLFALEKSFTAAMAIGCLATEAIAGLASPFDPRIQALRGQPGQIEVGRTMKTLLDNGPMRAISESSGKVQDPYSIRCQPQVLGACLDLIRNASATLEIESNAASDNPLIFTDTGEVISGGNFHAEPVAFAADMLAIAITEIGNLSERRCNLLLDPSFSGLPAMLTPDAGLNSGYMTAHISAAAMASENKQRAHPASIDTIPTAGNQEDHVSMATHGARRLLEMNDTLRGILSIEALCAAQALDLRGGDCCSPPLKSAFDAIRARVPFMSEDRPIAPDMASIAQSIRSGELVQQTGLASFFS